MARQWIDVLHSIWLLTNFAQPPRQRGLGEVFVSVLTQNREGAQSMLRPSLCCAARTWILDIRIPTLSGPQERVLRRTVEQNVDAVTFPTLDVPMPQMVDQPLALLLSAHFPHPEQVIQVPKISLPFRPTQIPEDIAVGGTVGRSAAGRCRKVRACRADH